MVILSDEQPSEEPVSQTQVQTKVPRELWPRIQQNWIQTVTKEAQATNERH